jgi:riboflavin synthase
MFTGIIESIGTVAEIKREQGAARIRITDMRIAGELQTDDSVAINGICLTVVASAGNDFEADAVPESLSRTTIPDWKKGRKVNLERGMPVSGRFDGHLVQGHVDATARLQLRKKQGKSRILTFETAEDLSAMMVEKGSIAIDGVSLTLLRVEARRFSVALIPYTLEHSTLGALRPGEQVNIETDIVGKYIVRQIQANKNLTEELLKKWGYRW